MTPDEMDSVKKLIWELNEKRTIDRDEILQIVRIMRRLMNSYQGSIKKQYKLRDRLRRKHDENKGH